MRISEREKLVLNAIVDYYLTVGDTIGSRTLVKKYGIELSSATIRNVMADLEDMGFIEKTHTSSGRIPTDMGYKYYLTELLKVEKITQEEIENISNVYNRRVDELENILKQTSTLLSKLTNYAGIAVEPKPDNTKVDRVELVYIDEYLIMAVIVMEDRRVKTKNIHLPYPITKDEVDKKVVELNDKIKNNEIAINDIEKFFTESSDIIYEYDDEDELSKYFINNLPGVLKDRDIEEVTDVIEFFNERKDIRDLFEKLIEQKAKENSKTNVNVILGDELGIKELEDFSFVYSIYNLGGAQGIIGVMGPKRMAYSKTMGLINHVSREVNKVINSMEREKNKKV
ncbi:MAG: heat-inducible transcriptional repressor HrcA [Fusobacterium periodonticum]|jgi:heat-inducible transcription repressor hrcA|uniref:heat-inducible transcriptional repressor HrcA n=1 Tax=Fusobacterium pseudoperiodonticum TaxID=2663009 RepID=UPI001CAD052E|nr:heat-inducible transcriptional repressor HrcA [Fusobacterium pseudoperiodonticum]MBF1219201.1 heat-inducible transcription repressor HrcA [Fusobacterium periodonticum]MDU5802869.1 heat-inducible transcriptional repressor HrcA [Fusobacterium periodonticum]